MQRLLSLTLVSAALACGDGSDSDPDPAACTAATAQATTEVAAAAGNQFTPACIRVAAGETVTWTNDDATTHTVTFEPPGPAVNATLPPATTFQHLFPSAGTFPYRCTLHAGMTATVIVE